MQPQVQQHALSPPHCVPELGIDGAFTDYAGTLHRYLHGKLYQKP